MRLVGVQIRDAEHLSEPRNIHSSLRRVHEFRGKGGARAMRVAVLAFALDG